ncbi:hypothetical protein [Stackebrandtia nassauensis]|uniref:Uncharacterized protein n=1 Tax=Stackebrandtia nassauensis (strain DSM 44728 / CIP 108903 / NRRL B-16338 / NBRC 102104 / LLR-40K-21) TaxID=446470 RepID=D3Q2M6_STANL|nr:hypothetical protein [Stackebrandtia nassauensis]ADD45777.1 hypothetical protein Snas_6154 [Stackebrandtia nassauensis DSM 44728]
MRIVKRVAATGIMLGIALVALSPDEPVSPLVMFTSGPHCSWRSSPW